MSSTESSQLLVYLTTQYLKHIIHINKNLTQVPSRYQDRVIPLCVVLESSQHTMWGSSHRKSPGHFNPHVRWGCCRNRVSWRSLWEILARDPRICICWTWRNHFRDWGCEIVVPEKEWRFCAMCLLCRFSWARFMQVDPRSAEALRHT